MIRLRTKWSPPRPPQRERGPGGEGSPRLARSIARAATLLFLCVLCASALSTVEADGEVGLVIEQDGRVDTYCLAYEGDSISGDDLLTAAGLSYEDLGTGAGSVLCAIEDVGCFDASSYSTCWCECQGSGGSGCVYWAFFTRDYGEGWVYSARAFDRADANDGDLHAWKWGQGGPSSAPRPSDAITFDSVCGHPPGAGATSTSTAPPTTAPTRTQPPGTSGTTAAPETTDTPFSAVPSTTSPGPGVSVTFSPQPGTTRPLPPATARDGDGDGGSPAALVAFAAVAVALVGAIAAAAYWRRSHGP